MEKQQDLLEEENSDYARMAPIRKSGDKQPFQRKHKWNYGVPEKQGQDNKRKDFCRYCGCIRDITIAPNKKDWVDGYTTLRGENSTKAPKCE